MKSGVSKGSDLGPILHAIFTPDLPITNKVTIATYFVNFAILARNDYYAYFKWS